MDLQCDREILSVAPELKTKIRLLEQIKRLHCTHRKVNDQLAMAQSKCNTAISLLFAFGMLTIVLRFNMDAIWVLIPLMVALLVGSISMLVQYNRLRRYAFYDCIGLKSSIKEMASQIEKTCGVGCVANVLDDTIRMYYSNLVRTLTQK